MKTITIVRELTGGANELTYVPVPCRGTVSKVRVVSDTEMVVNGWLKVGRGDVATAANVVNTVTVPTGNITAGIALDGVPDTDYKGLVFDDTSDTIAYQSMWLETDVNFFAGDATLTIQITYDDSAYVELEASEA